MEDGVVNRIVNVYLQKNNEIIRTFVITFEGLIEKKMKKPEKCDITVNVYESFFELFFRALLNSQQIRLKVLMYSQLTHFNAIIVINSIPPSATIDILGGGYLQTMVNEKVICDTAMSYLSTLGGAFSALGDSLSYCAAKAGEISCKQYKIALRVQEEPLVARCKLYMALSLIQQGSLKLAKNIILEQALVAKKFQDFRLANMCKGVWAKLQYCKTIYKYSTKIIAQNNSLMHVC